MFPTLLILLVADRDATNALRIGLVEAAITSARVPKAQAHVASHHHGTAQGKLGGTLDDVYGVGQTLLKCGVGVGIQEDPVHGQSPASIWLRSTIARWNSSASAASHVPARASRSW